MNRLSSNLSSDYPDVPENIIIDQFSEHLRTYGNPYDTSMDIVADGEIHRYRIDKDSGKRNEDGAYQLHADGHPNGWVLNWADGTGKEVRWDFDHKAYREQYNIKPQTILTDEKRAQIKAANEAKKKQAEAERQAKINDAAKKAAELYNANDEARDFPAYVHKYLHKKGLQSANGLHIKGFNTPEETLIVPLYNTSGEIRGLQYIYPDPENPDKFVKKYNANCDRDGTFCVIQPCAGDDVMVGALPDKAPNGPICFCEGLATGLTVYNAIQELQGIVVCALDCHNLEKVAVSIMNQKGYNGHEAFFFADNDHETYRKDKAKGAVNNPGLDGALMAARAIGVAPECVLAPNFTEAHKKMSDWNDLYVSLAQTYTPDEIKSKFAKTISSVIENTRNGKSGFKDTEMLDAVLEKIETEEAERQAQEERKAQRERQARAMEREAAARDDDTPQEASDQQETPKQRTQKRDYRKMPTSDDINRAMFADTFEDFRREMQWLSLTPLQPEELAQICADWINFMFPKDMDGNQSIPPKVLAFKRRVFKGPTAGDFAQAAKEFFTDEDGTPTLIYVHNMGFYKYEHGNWNPIEDIEAESLIYVPAHWETGRKGEAAFRELKKLVLFADELNTYECMNFKNGMLDLATGELLPHDPRFYSTMQVDYEYDPEATCPVFDAYFEKFTNGNKQRQKVLQEYAGYSMFSDNRLQKTLFLMSNGRNGKSLFFAILTNVFGSQNTSALRLPELKDGFNRIKLKDAMINFSSDTPPILRDVEELIKSIVAGDPITGSKKFKDVIRFSTRAKLFSSFNNTPTVNYINDGTAERIIPIYCVRKFIDNPQGELEEKPDTQLLSKILKELSGVFNWAYAGYKRLIEQGCFSLSPDTLTFKAEFNDENDPLLAFLNAERIILCAQSITTENLHKRYCDWARMNRPSAMITRNAFTRRVKLSAQQNGIIIRPEGKNNAKRYVRIIYPGDFPDEFKTII